jgi:flagellar assembly factor FliW
MKVLPEIYPTDIDTPPDSHLILPQGLIGFGDHRGAELLYMPDHLPFIWMRLDGPEPVHFIVIEPGGIIPGYEPELFDEDALQLGIGESKDVMILNIVTLKRAQPVEATVNLIGPVVVNRRTRTGRQLVISNHARYSAQYPLVENPQAPVACTA